MRWPWQRRAVETRSAAYTDQVVNSLLSVATGGGSRTALVTAALEQCATLYAAALANCELTGPPSITRALDASWRAAVASSLIRRGEAVYVIGADPVDGLALDAGSTWDIMGGPRRESWRYRVELSGPTASSWRTLPAAAILHLRWITDPDQPWRGVAPMQHAADTGALAGWLDKRLAEESSGPVGSFLPLARYEPDPDADLDDADAAADPLARLRSDIGRARGQVLTVESAMASADSPASAPRKDFQVARFGANPPRDLVELRAIVTRDVGAACGIPRAMLDSSASGQAARESWRQWVATAVDGLCRRVEAQVLDQLGTEIQLDSTPLAGRDLAARTAAFRRLRDGGLTVDDARQAAGI